MVVPCWINESSDIVRVPTPVRTYICVDEGKAITYDHRLRRTGHPVRSAIQRIDSDKKIDNDRRIDGVPGTREAGSLFLRVVSCSAA
jgi:hypothetical protein